MSIDNYLAAIFQVFSGGNNFYLKPVVFEDMLLVYNIISFFIQFCNGCVSKHKWSGGYACSINYIGNQGVIVIPMFGRGINGNWFYCVKAIKFMPPFQRIPQVVGCRV